MSIDITQHMHLKLEIDGMGGVKVFGPADIRNLFQQVMVHMMSPEVRLKKVNGNPEIIMTLTKLPPTSMEKNAESDLRKLNEVIAGLDLSDVEILDTEVIESMRNPAMKDPRIRRLIQINAMKSEFENSLPSERLELVNYAKAIWPEFMENFELKHLSNF